MWSKFKTIIALSVFLCGLSVLLGAFGAHALNKVLSVQKMEVFNKASYYMMVHGLSVIILILVKNTTNLRIETWTIFSMFFGVIIFSTALYLVAISELAGCNNLRFFGAVAPVGGVLMIVSWFYNFYTILRSK